MSKPRYDRETCLELLFSPVRPTVAGGDRRSNSELSADRANATDDPDVTA